MNFKEKIVLEYIKGKNVLDIGSVGQNTKGFWQFINRYAKSAKGIDIEKGIVDKNIVHGNMENYNFKKKFDVIVAGDIIEHVDNQGLFLQNIKKHMRKDSKFILTTPNCKWFTVILKPNPTHTLWHDKYTLSYLLKKHGFKIDYFSYYVGNKQHYILPKRILAFRQGILLVCSLK